MNTIKEVPGIGKYKDKSLRGKVLSYNARMQKNNRGPVSL